VWLWLLSTHTWGGSSLWSPTVCFTCYPQRSQKQENQNWWSKQVIVRVWIFLPGVHNKSQLHEVELPFTDLKNLSSTVFPETNSRECLAALHRKAQGVASTSTVVQFTYCTRQLILGENEAEIQPMFYLPSPAPWHWLVSVWKGDAFSSTQRVGLHVKPCAIGSRTLEVAS
jgi:hypothetical protein